jgi:hypothetical protein
MYGRVEELHQGVDFNKGATSPRYGQVEELHQGEDGWRSFTTALQIWSLRLERCVFFHFSQYEKFFGESRLPCISAMTVANFSDIEARVEVLVVVHRP